MIRCPYVAAAALSLTLGALPMVASAAAPALNHAAAHAASAAKKPPAQPKAHKPAAPVRDPQVDRWIDVAGFGAVAVYKPKVASRGLALFASGDGGWNLGVTDMAHEAAAQGYWVAGFSTPQFLKGLDSGQGACSDADGLLAKLGDDLIRRLNLPLETRPIVIGYSSGATIVYAVLAADAGQRLGGGISLGFCPDLLIHKAFCPGVGGLTRHWQKQPPTWVFDKRETVKAPWRILQGESDQVCDPAFAPDFAAGQADSKAIMLPKVGHGFGVPKNWMPQYAQSVKDLLGATTR
ncbi:MAG: AcvB/VirJ family lysyl-phosphatidylglycerol hydrolase [Lysobacterales bacterium]